jgi:hypothetical protein
MLTFVQSLRLVLNLHTYFQSTRSTAQRPSGSSRTAPSTEPLRVEMQRTQEVTVSDATGSWRAQPIDVHVLDIGPMVHAARDIEYGAGQDILLDKSKDIKLA